MIRELILRWAQNREPDFVIASTSNLSVRQMGEYLERWIAFAAEHGVQVSEPLPPHLRPQRRAKRNEHIDADGVITEVTA